MIERVNDLLLNAISDAIEEGHDPLEIASTLTINGLRIYRQLMTESDFIGFMGDIQNYDYSVLGPVETRGTLQ